MIRIPVPVVLSKRTVGTTVAAAILACAGAMSAMPASASVPRAAVSNTFNCSASVPEICVGINHSGTFVYSVEAQVNVSQHSNVTYDFFDPIFEAKSVSGGPGWVPSAEFPVNQNFDPGVRFCAEAFVNSAVTTGACVILP